MPDSEKIHRLSEKHDSFAELLESIDSDEKAARLLRAVEEVGEEVETVIDSPSDEFSTRDDGWLRIVWEAHYRDMRTREHKPE